jgi:hypothetical protein
MDMEVSDNMSWLFKIITILLHTMGINISIFLATITLNFLHVFSFSFYTMVYHLYFEMIEIHSKLFKKYIYFMFLSPLSISKGIFE